jgi:predicted kinase
MTMTTATHFGAINLIDLVRMANEKTELLDHLSSDPDAGVFRLSENRSVSIEELLTERNLLWAEIERRHADLEENELASLEQQLKAALSKIIDAANTRPEPVHSVLQNAIQEGYNTLLIVDQIEKVNQQLLDRQKVKLEKLVDFILTKHTR